MSVCALVGGQFGSEGKGLILSKIAREYDNHVRVGAANAGHTIYDDDGEKHVMQQLPCAAYANPNADLWIGPGAQIKPDIFRKEIEVLDAWRHDRGYGKARINVDHRAHVIQPVHVEMEAQSTLQERIGSTSATAREGIGSAQAARVMRDETCVQAGDWSWEPGDGVVLTDVPAELAENDSILLEGTQGTGLSLTTGDFPYVTSRNTTAAGLAADCGVAPNRLYRIIVVCRTYPIRVAGNSGPFHPASRGITWEDIDVDSETERTTVTKKIRRVATFSIEQVQEACYLNGATEIALTFMDYLDPMIGGERGDWDDLRGYPKISNFVSGVESETNVNVTMLGTGPNSVIHLK